MVKLYYAGDEYAIERSLNKVDGIMGELLDYDQLESVVTTALKYPFTNDSDMTDWPCPLADGIFFDFVTSRWPY